MTINQRNVFFAITILLFLQLGASKNLENPSKLIAVNYHFTRKCNYNCGFCFHTSKNSHVESLDNAKEIIQQLADYGFQKINFAGGEPFLPEYKTQLGEMMKFAKLKGNFESVSVISNGHHITDDWFQLYSSYLDILGLSCDSDDDIINAHIGRGFGEHTSKIKSASKLANKYDVMLKLNTGFFLISLLYPFYYY